MPAYGGCCPWLPEGSIYDLLETNVRQGPSPTVNWTTGLQQYHSVKQDTFDDVIHVISGVGLLDS